MSSSTSTPIVPYQKQPVEFQEYDPLSPEVAQYVTDVIQMQIPSVPLNISAVLPSPAVQGEALLT
jgi:hypothetical protein